MYWKQVGHVKRSRLPESVICSKDYGSREVLKAGALREGYPYMIFCKPRLIEHTYFKVDCEVLYMRDEPRENYDGTRQFWTYIWCKFKYPNLNPQILEGKTEYQRDAILEEGIYMNDYHSIPRKHFNNISKVIGAVFDYGSEYFTIR